MSLAASMVKQNISEKRRKYILNYISEEYFSDIVSFTKQRLDELPNHLVAKYRLEDSIIQSIITDWLQSNKLYEYTILYHENFLKTAKAYELSLRENNTVVDNDFIQKLISWCSEIKNIDMDDRAFMQFCKRNFIFEYICHVYRESLR